MGRDVLGYHQLVTKHKCEKSEERGNVAEYINEALGGGGDDAPGAPPPPPK